MTTIIPIFTGYLERKFKILLSGFTLSSVMNRNMFSLGDDFKIAKPIVGTVFILVMNKFIAFKFSFKMFFHNITMFKDFFIVNIKNNISMPINRAKVKDSYGGFHFKTMPESSIVGVAKSKRLMFSTTIFNGTNIMEFSHVL